MPGDGRDLGLGAAGDRQPSYGSTAQVMERQADDADTLARFAPRRAETVGRPRCAVAVGQDNRAALRRGIECSL